MVLSGGGGRLLVDALDSDVTVASALVSLTAISLSGPSLTSLLEDDRLMTRLLELASKNSPDALGLIGSLLATDEAASESLMAVQGYVTLMGLLDGGDASASEKASHALILILQKETRLELLLEAGVIERLLTASARGGAEGGAADGALELIAASSEANQKRIEGARAVAALEASFA